MTPLFLWGFKPNPGKDPYGLDGERSKESTYEVGIFIVSAPFSDIRG